MPGVQRKGEPAGSGGRAQPAGSGGRAQPAGSGGRAQPAGSGGRAQPAGSGGTTPPIGPDGAAAVAPTTGPTWERLEDQIAWYGRKARAAQKWYKRMKLIQLGTGAAIPVAVLLNLSDWVPGVIGAAVVVLEGAQQLYRHHEHWITYRSTSEALKRERYLYLALAGPYASAPKPLTLLAENVEVLLSQEQQKWALNQAAQPGKAGSSEKATG